MLRVKSLSKIYANQVVGLHDCSFEASAGEFIGLIGCNGSGKSTLMHCLAGASHPTSGSIQIDLESLNKRAWVSQITIVDWYLNVADNIRLGARLGGKSSRESAIQVDTTLKLVNLEHKRTLLPDVLSGGEQKRMQLGRALAQDADILLLDEPTVSLDVQNSEKLLESFQHLCSKGTLVILASHELDLLQNYITRVWMLKDNHLVSDMPVKTFIQTYAPSTQTLKEAFKNVQTTDG